ncbi:MAG: hypothetical protein J6X49_14140, partial [Victivallales bacterium]|nr:hypothetical protein [Victivallales bacterium]
MIDINDIWSKVSEGLKASMNKNTYDLWIEGIVPVHLTETEFVLGVSNDFLRDWMSNHFVDVIGDKLFETAGLRRRVTFESGHEKPRVEVVDPVGANPAVEEAVVEQQPASDLNSRFTFDRFVVGDGSQYAYSACLAVAESPGTAFNPLLIHSSIGLGKTHLLQAISHDVLRRNPK